MPITMSVLRRADGQAIPGSAGKVDGAGNLFVAELLNNGHDAWIEVRKIASSGAVLWQDRFDPLDVAGLNKVDSVWLAASGTDLFVGGSCHSTDQAQGRPYFSVMGIARGVYAPFQQAQEDGAGAFQPGVEPPPPPPAPGPTLTEIVAAVMAAIRAEFGGNIRQGIQDKARDGAIQAITQTGVLTEGTVHDSHNLYRRLDEILYEYGFRRPPQEPEQPQ